MKIALIHDWLITYGGAERVLKEIFSLFPDADVFTLISDADCLEQIGIPALRVKDSFIAKLPKAKTKYRSYLALFPLAIEDFDLSEYDLIISSSFSVAKGVMVNSNQLHICYCHSPVRYAWDLYHQYLREANLEKGLKSWIAKSILHKIRVWDAISSNRVDYFIANSNYIAKRIKRVYNRNAVTIYPNVDVENFQLVEKKENFYFTCSRLVPYKRIDLIVEAFALMPDKKLIVIGDGPEMKKIRSKAKPNITLMGFQPNNVLHEYMGKAKAFVFAAEEDFGIVPVEAQAFGTPVIAYGKGGVLETVKDGETGLFFDSQTTDAIINAVNLFEKRSMDFLPESIRKHAEQFNTTRFNSQFKTFVESCITASKI